MTWFFTDLARFKAEREAIETFGLMHEWFVFGGWRYDDRMRLVLDADIIAGGKTWPIYLQFPEFYPDAPPSVFPAPYSSVGPITNTGRAENCASNTDPITGQPTSPG